MTAESRTPSETPLDMRRLLCGVLRACIEANVNVQPKDLLMAVNMIESLSSDLAAARQQLASAERVWRPIENAPKDGTEILAWRDDAGAFMARWTCLDNFLTDSELVGIPSDVAEIEDWFSADFVQGGRMDGDLAPTHWTPLPHGPAALRGGSE